MSIDAARIARDRALAEAASPEPWTVDEGGDVDGTPFRHIEGWRDEGDGWMCLDAADAAFIAAARSLLPEYVTEVERLGTENARLRTALSEIQAAVDGLYQPVSDGLSALPPHLQPWAGRIGVIRRVADEALNGGAS